MHAPLQHLGRVYREHQAWQLGDVPAEIRSLLNKLSMNVPDDLNRCPACRRTDAMITVLVGAVGAFDERHCRYCHQVVLESASPSCGGARQ